MVTRVNSVTICTVVSMVSQQEGDMLQTGGRSQNCIQSKAMAGVIRITTMVPIINCAIILKISIFELSNFELLKHHF
jgi:hypothetical protein